ncbi:MAG: DNA-3-methyladenine glycosylase I, partial [Pseudomonadales bacterium]
DPVRLVGAGEADVVRWLDDSGLIRHRGKIEAMINNARRVMEAEGEFAGMLWSFVEGVPQQSSFRRSDEVPGETPTSVAMAKHLKKKGFRFVGPTICYAFMQSAGLVNDHLMSCDGFDRCSKLGAAWTL